MSRCFPFPPPGYEKKLRVEDVSLLAKEKDKEISKEKKHKKDREKDKKDGKVKSKERHKEKDKEKHRDKEKDKDKRKEKKRSREEKKSDGNRPNVEKAGSNSPDSSAQELEKRINFGDGATRSQTVHPIYDRDEGKDKLFDGVGSRSNGAYGAEAKGGVDQIANGQRENFPSKYPKIVFSNGAEQRTAHISRPTSNEGEEMQNHPSNSRKGERNKGKICTPEKVSSKSSNGAKFVIARESAIVKEFDRRVKDENGATGSQSGVKINVTIQKRDEISRKLPNGNSFSNSKVATVHNVKTEERGCEVTGDVGTRKNFPLEVRERNGYVGKPDVSDRMKIQSKNEDRSHFTVKFNNRTSEVVSGKRKEPEANGILYGNEARPSKLQKTTVSPQPSTENGRNFNMSTTINLPASKQVPAIGLKLEGDAYQSNCSVNPMGPTPGNETRPSKLQKTVVSLQPSTENGRKVKTSTINTMSASKQVPPGDLKLDGDEYKSNWTVGAQSHPVPKKSPSASVKPVGPPPGQSPLGSIKPSTSTKGNGTVGDEYKSNWTVGSQSHPVPKKSPSASVKPLGPPPGQSLLGSTKPSTSMKGNGTVGVHGLPSAPTKPSLSVGKVHGKTVSQDLHLGSTKPPLTAGKANGIISTHGPPPILTEDMAHIKNAPERVGYQQPAKPQLIPGEVNGTVGAHESLPVMKKPSSSSKKEKRKHKSSSKPVPPHPDTKYLSQILSVPKMEELSELDDQGWLFESKNSSMKEEHDIGGEQVWAKAVNIESADIYALPYVIPY